MSLLLLVLMISIGNFALGFGLAAMMGYGPDWFGRSLFQRDASSPESGDHS